jgi:hypothetical protein
VALRDYVTTGKCKLCGLTNFCQPNYCRWKGVPLGPINEGPAPTGLLDAKGCPIFEGDLIRVGMRRGDAQGWTLEKVVRANGRWMLADPKTGELMEMQTDMMLRVRVGPST